MQAKKQYNETIDNFEHHTNKYVGMVEGNFNRKAITKE